jgi:selT/selW/selH-like putative selenoprotein
MINRFSDQIGEITLHAGQGGAFEVSIDGEQIYSKLETKRYPELSELIDPLQARVAAGTSS